MKKNRFYISFIVTMLFLAITLLLTGCSSGTSKPDTSTPTATSTPTTAEKPKVYEWKLGSSNPEGSPFAVFLDKFVKEVKEKTNGRVVITNYHNNALGAATDQYAMAKKGSLELINQGAAQGMGLFPVADIVQLPYFISNPTEAVEVMNRLYREGLLPEYEKEGLKVLFFMPTDMQMICFRNKKVESLKDLSGMKIRAVSGSLLNGIKAMGATPVAITTTEVYMSLEKGVIDGAISSPGAMNAFKFYEPAKYLLNMPICTGINMCSINKDLWNSLPPDLQVILDEISDKYAYEYLKAINDDEKNSLAKMKAGGMNIYTISPEEEQKIRVATAPVWDEYVKRVTDLGYDGKKIMDTAKEVLERCETHLR